MDSLALKAFSPEDTLPEWTTVKTDLVDILWKSANALRSHNLVAAIRSMEEAIRHGHEVLRFLEGQHLSQRRALAHYNLGNAYGDRLTGNRTDNQTQAIGHYEQALRFYTRENYPMRWADTHNNLGVTYQERGGKAEDIERAIAHFEQALTTCTPDTAPVLTRRIARNLGNLFFYGQQWLKAVTPYRLALESAEYLYQASLVRSSKAVELVEMSDLYLHAAYALARSGNCQEACAALERGRTRLLAEVLERDRADLETLPQRASVEVYDRYVAATNRLTHLESMELQREKLISGF